MRFPVGKLPPDVLAKLLGRGPVADPRVLIGPAIGEDAAVIDFGETCLVAKTDPITFATDEIGWYAVNVNANDVVSMGARPRWFLATLLLPEQGTDEKLVERIHADILDACKALDISLVGGHTEITHGLSRPIVAGQMLGEVRRDRLVSGDGMSPGDRLLLTKGIAVEGTAIIAREGPADLRERVDAELLSRSEGFLHDPGISVVREALAACEGAGVKAMHDPTEGGLASGLWELAQRAALGARVRADAIPVFEETRTLCAELGLDPMGLIASGALLIVAAPDQSADVANRVRKTGVVCEEIGELVPLEQGLIWITAEGESPWPTFERDEIARVFGS